MKMIIFENSDEAINGLAKLIIQDPIFPIWIKSKQIELIKNSSMIDNKEYINQQNQILEKAENIASQQTGYIFEINKDKSYMIYKKIDNEMIPVIKKFEESDIYAFKFNNLIEFLKKSKLKNLITLDGNQTKPYFYTHPSVRKKEDYESSDEYESDFIDNNSYHNPVKFNKTQEKLLKKLKIEMFKLDDDQEYMFIKDLKNVTKTDHLKPFEQD